MAFASSRARFAAVARDVRPWLLLSCGLAGTVVAVLGCAVPSSGWLPIDALSALFLLPLFIAATADRAPRAGIMLAILATAIAAHRLEYLVIGFELAAILARCSPLGAVPLLAAAALLGGGAFDAIRNHELDAIMDHSGHVLRDHAFDLWRANALFVLLLAAVLPRLFLFRGAVLGLPIAGTYLLARLLLDVGSPVAQVWWGPALLVAGAMISVWGGWRANLAGTLDQAIGTLVAASLGGVAGAAGLVLLARGSDLPDAAALSGGALTLGALSTAAAAAVGKLACDEFARQAGTLRLDALGGLAALMPLTSLALAVCVVSLAGLPPTVGFGWLWMFAQALLSLTRTGGAAQALAVSLAAAGFGLAAALAVAAGVRLLATTCLGRPRTPRGAAAGDVRGPARAGLAGATGLLALFGIAPGAVLSLTAPAVRALSGTDRTVAPPAWLPAVVLGLIVVMAAILHRRPAQQIGQWEDGRGPPPSWLPFGDPAEQWSAASFAAAFQPALAWARPAFRSPPPLVLGVGLFLGLLVLSILLSLG